MSDQPILQQEVDPVRGLVKGLAWALHEITATVRGECPSLLDEDSGGSAELSIRIDELLASYRAWEEGGGPTERAERGVRGRLQAPPSEGTTSAPADGEPSFTLVFAGDLTKFSKNPLRTDTPFGRPYAAGIGNAFEELEALSGAALEAAGVDSADTLSYPIPSPPAGVDRPETEGEKIARAALEACRVVAREAIVELHDKGRDQLLLADRIHKADDKAREALALLAQQKERG